jgi:hypothetical protein
MAYESHFNLHIEDFGASSSKPPKATPPQMCYINFLGIEPEI